MILININMVNINIFMKILFVGFENKKQSKYWFLIQICLINRQIKKYDILHEGQRIREKN